MNAALVLLVLSASAAQGLHLNANNDMRGDTRALLVLHSLANATFDQHEEHIYRCWLDNFLNSKGIKHVDVHALDLNASKSVEKYISQNPKAKERVHVYLETSPSKEKRTEWFTTVMNQSKEVNRNLMKQEQHTTESEMMEMEWPSLDYMQRFFGIVRSYLDKGQHVLHADTDAPWIEDPWPVLKRIIQAHPDVDVISMTEGDSIQKSGKAAPNLGFSLNTGFVLIRATKNSMNMAKFGQKWSESAGKPRRPLEQGLLNNYVADSNCKWTNSKGQEWIRPAKNMTNFYGKIEWAKFVSNSTTMLKNFVDEEGLFGSSKRLNVVALDPKLFVRGSSHDLYKQFPDAIVMHPQISWNSRTWHVDAYERLKALVPEGTCK